ncbi:hypothetical protein [Micromonospora sp. NBC_01796]|uniref:hypothetical protein n=1 Tax=Micromonospora sp. NBC_01796 TaxID=2975987 RepID=UPI002DD80757|nr:hypothetical protein [Micromonospora sp. NBC_01796]WSA83989.1 hypothetical protein OIE47_26995 [Micromonospora sp. NBC_01796]
MRYVNGRLSLPDVVQLQLVIDPFSDRAGAVQAARSWFDLGWRQLGGELREAAVAQASGDTGVARALSPFGVEAGMAFSYGFLGQEISRDMGFSDESWAELLAAMAKLPSALFVAGTLTADGRAGEVPRIYEASHYLEIMLRPSFGPGGRYSILTLRLRADSVLTAPEREAVMPAVLKAVAASTSPVFGEISYSYTSPLTAMEYVLRTDPSIAFPDPEQVLRGYSWVTVVPEEMGLALGGRDRLAGSGAFWNVERLPRGGYWLQATERFADYRQAEAERVFDVLRPHLPANAYASDFRDARRPIPGAAVG